MLSHTEYGTEYDENEKGHVQNLKLEDKIGWEKVNHYFWETGHIWQQGAKTIVVKSRKANQIVGKSALTPIGGTGKNCLIRALPYG